jgi:hypothetical protein
LYYVHKVAAEHFEMIILFNRKKSLDYCSIDEIDESKLIPCLREFLNYDGNYMNNKSISEKQITIHCQEVGNITEEN